MEEYTRKGRTLGISQEVLDEYSSVARGIFSYTELIGLLKELHSRHFVAEGSFRDFMTAIER